MRVSQEPEDVLATYSLGSCIGVSLYDPQLQLGGLIHCMLPMSSIDQVKAKATPWMFADTGMTCLLQALFDRGAARSRLIAKVAGAGNPVDDKNIFNIGARNLAVLRKVLWKNSILLKGEDTGGTCPRNLYLHVASGRTTIRTGREEYEL